MHQKKHNFEETKDDKEKTPKPFININDLKCYETKAEML